MSDADERTGGGDLVDGDGAGAGDRLAALAAAESLADLTALTGADDEHAAYFDAKREWAELWRRRQQSSPGDADDAAALPGEVVTLGDTDFHVHGVTHAGTDAERSYLREGVVTMLSAGATVYVEQGLRQLHFRDVDVCEMDDYRWALQRCDGFDDESDAFHEPLHGVGDRFDGLADQFRETAFSLIESYSDLYGETVERTLGALASSLLTDHEGFATGDEYEAFALRRRAAADPAQLPALQDYYRRAFLPQPVEREWVRRHDPDLEWVTHGRNERMADYAVYHYGDAEAVHLIVGAAHGPGVVYSLRQHRDGERFVEGFTVA